MIPFRFLVLTGTVLLVASTGVIFAARYRTTALEPRTPPRVRGKIIAVDDGSVTIRERNGRTIVLKTGPGTAYADVIPSSLSEIRLNDYIGTAVKGEREHWIAVEIVLVPESMQAGRKGDYAWDPLPDTSGINAKGIVATRMTNGTVTATHNTAEGRSLTVNLVSDETAHIAVSSTAPIVRFIPNNRSVVHVGSTTVVWTGTDNQAKLVAVGKGVLPPM